MKHAGKIIALLVAVLVVAGVVSYYLQPGLPAGIEAKTFDLRFRAWRGPRSPAGTIAIIAIDDKSIAELGRWPWDRRLFADLVAVTAAAGARGLAIDVLFTEPQSADADAAFAGALRASGRVVLAEAFTLAEDGSAVERLAPLPQLREAAAGVAHINVFPDDDGVLRWSQLLIPNAQTLHPSLALAAAALAGGSPAPVGEPFRIRLGDTVIPTDAAGQLLINHRGPAGSLPQLSFVDVVKGRVPAEALRDRLLLVGPTALGLYDMRISPFSNNIPGVEIHAQIADNLLQRDFFRRGGSEALIDLLCIVGLGLLVGVVALRLRAAIAFPLVVLLSLLHIALALAFFAAGRWINLVYPQLTVVAVYSAVSYLRFLLLDRKAREIRAIFSSYVSPKVVDQLVQHPELARVGGDSRVVTILFADVKNYTGYSEARTPREVVTTLNEYLAEMTHAIHDFDGTLDKFMGDGILAYWGAPLPQPDHGERAVRCALEMLRRLDRLHAKWQAEGTEPICCGIGLHTGEVIAGNLGAEGKKMEYTVIGDAVNLTFRIQNESREAGAPVLTAALHRLVGDLVVADPLGPVLVKGKQQPVEIFALRGLRPDPLPPA